MNRMHIIVIQVSKIIFFALGMLLCFSLYWGIIHADYLIALKIAKIVFENSVEDGFAVSHIQKMAYPCSLSNTLFATILQLCFFCGVIAYLRGPYKLTVFEDQDQNNSHNLQERIILILFLLFLNLLPIAFIQATYSVHARLSFLLLILYVSFVVASIICFCAGKYICTCVVSLSRTFEEHPETPKRGLKIEKFFPKR